MTNKNKNNSKKETDQQNKKNLQDNFDWKRAGKTSFIWLFIIFGAVYISGLLTQSGKKEVEVEYTEYRKYLENGDIQKGVIMGDTFHGEFKLPQTIDTPIGTTLNEITHFKLTLPFIQVQTSTELEYDIPPGGVKVCVVCELDDLEVFAPVVVPLNALLAG